MIAIRRMIWNTWNEKHIIRHGVIPDEVEEVCQHNPLVQRGKYETGWCLLATQMKSG
jgi:hypothetical protein